MRRTALRAMKRSLLCRLHSAAQLISKPDAIVVALPRSITHSDQVRMQLDVRSVQYLKEHHLHVYLTDLLR